MTKSKEDVKAIAVLPIPLILHMKQNLEYSINHELAYLTYVNDLLPEFIKLYTITTTVVKLEHESNHFPMMQVVLLVLVAGYVSGANILILQDIPSPSHSIWTAELARGLVKRGHNVTRVAPGNFREHNRGKDYHAIYFEGVGGGEAVITDLIQASTYKTMLLFYEYDIEACKAIYQSKGLEKLLEYPSDSFDAVVIDITLGGCLLPLIKNSTIHLQLV
ncbi:unnamed protein product [Acanthoscelides obtectus]|uniref:Uncharacterized protein n=1 Tax=Acanthoscelides obtectus TaxID=200917 RepID=A0A9P0NXI1_ACAOB|nr:unnamed protein product [Acanthoscelides obtectus]CAK1661904.1 hypothetical protein AOBTE_LOCUS22867 [Acanthoscelides obtectus]